MPAMSPTQARVVSARVASDKLTAALLELASRGLR